MTMDNNEYKEKVDKRIKDIKDAFIKEFNPQKIILFGSFARGEYRENSSIDMLVITDTDISSNFIDRIKRAIKVSKGNPPVEPLIYNQSEIDLLLSQRDTFIDNILSEGQELYSKT